MGQKRKKVNTQGVLLLGVVALCALVIIQTFQEETEGGKIARREGERLKTLFGLSHKNNTFSPEISTSSFSPDETAIQTSLQPSNAQANQALRLAGARHAKNVTAFARLISNEAKGTLVLTYASISYKDAVVNWILSLERVGVKNWGVVCLDTAMRLFLEARGVPCFFVDSGDVANKKMGVKKIQELWILRLSHLVELLENEISVVFSDSDAVWLADAIKSGLLAERTGDIVVSRGKFPFELSEQWGATACMGLAYFRATPSVVEVVKRARKEGIVANDDQVGLNRALFQLYGVNPVGVFGNKVDLYSSSDDVAPATHDGLPRFVLIAHSKVPRFCSHVNRMQWQKDVQIAHCHAKDGVVAKTRKNMGDSTSRNAIMVKYDLWCPMADKSPAEGFLPWLERTSESCRFIKFRKPVQ